MYLVVNPLPVRKAGRISLNLFRLVIDEPPRGNIGYKYSVVLRQEAEVKNVRIDDGVDVFWSSS
jgi:hypothetical protein